MVYKYYKPSQHQLYDNTTVPCGPIRLPVPPLFVLFLNATRPVVRKGGMGVCLAMRGRLQPGGAELRADPLERALAADDVGLSGRDLPTRTQRLDRKIDELLDW